MKWNEMKDSRESGRKCLRHAKKKHPTNAENVLFSIYNTLTMKHEHA